MATPTVALRRMDEGDLDAVLAVQAVCYPPSMQEAAALLRTRLRSAPSTALVACLDGAVCAYVFAYSSVLGRVTPLDAPFVPAPAADTLYLHDLAVAPHAHGRGLARRMVGCLLDGAAADGLRHSALVSVQDTRAFWASFGYREDGARPRCAALGSYPGRAIYMRRAL